MGRRDKNDLKWQETKRIVTARDGGDCRLCKVLTAKEMGILRANAGQQYFILQHAHFLGVGPFPAWTYLVNNVVLLNAYSHKMLDEIRNPINGERLSSKEEHRAWWKRILGDSTYEEMLKREHESLTVD